MQNDGLRSFVDRIIERDGALTDTAGFFSRSTES